MRKLFPKLNISRQLLSRGVSLVVVFTTLVAAYAALSLNITLGWFSESTSAHANGMSAQVYDSIFEVTYTPVTLLKDANGNIIEKQLGVGVADSSGDLPFLTDNSDNSFNSFSDMIANVKVPGQSVTFDVTIKNIGEYSAVLKGFGLKAPGPEDDKPVKVEAKDESGNTIITDGVVQYRDCYLSTELTTHVAAVSASNAETTVALQSGVDARPLRSSTTADIDYFDWLTVNEVTLDSQESITFTVVIHFVDDPDHVQNYLKNYVASGGACKREIFITHN